MHTPITVINWLNRNMWLRVAIRVTTISISMTIITAVLWWLLVVGLSF